MLYEELEQEVKTLREEMDVVMAVLEKFINVLATFENGESEKPNAPL
jgi:hypothetical protein